MSEDTPQRSTLTVGTAGHIDHGKTSLVRALTGIDLDTLPEERDRGITIALGFTSLELASGRRVAFIDVPGHERLVRTMVAGAHGLDAVMLVVSAVDGVMPQTREHAAILDLLGIRQGVVVLSKVDLVDEEMLELAREDVAETLAGTALEHASVIECSTLTGQGTPELLAALDQLVPSGARTEGPFRLPVDRTFVRAGFGTVATGTALGGTLADGTRLRLLPQGMEARVRGIEVHGDSQPLARGGHRVALNLAGIERDDVPRGTMLCAEDLPVTSMIDVSYRHTSTAELADGTSVRVLHGTAERIGRFYLPNPDEILMPGSDTWAQLRLDQPLPCLRGDRFILRRTTPVETLGGGEILDPWARRLRKKDGERIASELKRLAKGDLRVLLERAGEEGLTGAEARRRGVDHLGVALGDRRFSERVVARLEGLLLDALLAFHREAPLSLGANRRELRRGRLAHLPDKVFDGLVERVAEHGAAVIEGPLVRARTFEIALTRPQQALQQQLTEAVATSGLAGSTPDGLRERFRDDALDALLRLLVADGRLLSVPKVGLVAPEHPAVLRDQLVAHFAGSDKLGPTDFKALTGLTRRHAIPWLEHLDRLGWTRRLADGRAAGSHLHP